MQKKFRSSGGYGFIFFVLLGLLIAFLPCSYADKLSAKGYWQTVDPDTKQVSSIIQITKNPKNGLYYGKIYKIFPENGHKPTDICVHCKGVQKNHPMLGLIIIRDMRMVGEGRYKGGLITDPRDGKEYHSKMTVVGNGQLLKLRGYIGIPLFGQTRTWHRVEKPTV